MKSIQSSAKTMEEAVTKGLEELGVSLGDVNIDILDEGSKGFLGLLKGKPVVVKLTVRDNTEAQDTDMAFSIAENKNKDSERQKRRKSSKTKTEKAKETVATGQDNAHETKSKTEPKPRQQDNGAAETEIVPAPMCDPETPEGKAQQFLLRATELMDVHVSVAAKRDEEGNVRVDMHGDTLGILIGRRGETLDALQYLTSLYVNRGQETYVRVTLDTENYRAKREEALTRLANRMASRAVKTGRKVVMEPMNPYERRVLHSALQQNESVTTHSEGEEPNRHVVISVK